MARPEKTKTDNGPGGRRFGRRGFLGGVGASGLTAAAVVFGFTPQASALVKRVPSFKMCPGGSFIAGCCCLCCPASGHSIGECMSGPGGYVWTCSKATLTCECCEHANACLSCDSNDYSAYSCSSF